jgi:post-segregation antitoxin (ccd killing protein)
MTDSLTFGIAKRRHMPVEGAPLEITPPLHTPFYSRVEGSVEYDHTLGHTQAMSTTERVTVTLSAELVEGIDRLERNRSRFIAEAIEHELARRRRESLLASVSNPHPETADAVNTGLGDWTADLPDEEGLVDVAGGTAVRWVEGQGWVKESA